MRTTGVRCIVTLGFCIVFAQVAYPAVPPHETQHQTSSPSAYFPDTLPNYYEQVFPGELSMWEMEETPSSLESKKLRFVSSHDEVIAIRYTPSSRTIEDRIFRTVLSSYGGELKKKGNFITIEPHLIQISVSGEEGFMRLITICGTPEGVLDWEYLSRIEDEKKRDLFTKKLLFYIGRQRYEEALAQGNVAMGSWEREIHEYAKLLSIIDPVQARAVYENHLKTAGYNYEAHLEYMKISDDDSVRSASARAILRNAEQEDLLSEAAMYLGEEVSDLASFGILEKDNRGLQLILIPLPPCNAQLLKEAAVIYEKMTGIPVKIRRLPESWTLKAPDRFPRQRLVERLLGIVRPDITDFAYWSFEQFRGILYQAVEEEGPMDVYKVERLFKQIEEEMKDGKGQWEIEPLLRWLQNALLPYRTDDVRTMYVGITGADIYSGDTNYLFSSHYRWKKSVSFDVLHASILSYARMSAEITDEHESRKRLVGRIAKELVPASLKSLSIPRSVDPTCPYSYASGLERLDEKTFELSDGVKEAIQKHNEVSR